MSTPITLTLGPQDGTLTLHTGAEGRAAKMGHALTIAMTDWSAEVALEGGQPTAVSFRTRLASLDVVKGDGGLKPLSDKDKRTVKDSALETLDAAKHPEVTFTGRDVTARDGGYEIAGELVIAGVTRALSMQVVVSREAGRARVSAEVPVVQTEFGIKPYSGLMGGLKVRDRVDVRLEATAADPGV